MDPKTADVYARKMLEWEYANGRRPDTEEALDFCDIQYDMYAPMVSYIEKEEELDLKSLSTPQWDWYETASKTVVSRCFEPTQDLSEFDLPLSELVAKVPEYSVSGLKKVTLYIKGVHRVDLTADAMSQDPAVVRSASKLPPDSQSVAGLVIALNVGVLAARRIHVALGSPVPPGGLKHRLAQPASEDFKGPGAAAQPVAPRPARTLPRPQMAEGQSPKPAAIPETGPAKPPIRTSPPMEADVADEADEADELAEEKELLAKFRKNLEKERAEVEKTREELERRLKEVAKREDELAKRESLFAEQKMAAQALGGPEASRKLSAADKEQAVIATTSELAGTRSKEREDLERQARMVEDGKAALKKAKDELASERAAFERAKQELVEKEKSLAARGAEVYAKAKDIAEKEADAKFAKLKEQAETARKLLQAKEDELKKRLDEADAELKRIRASAPDERFAEIGRKEKELSKREESLEGLEKKLDSYERELDGRTSALDEKERHLQKWSSELDAKRKEFEETAAKREKELEKREKGIDELERKLEAFDEELRTKEKALEEEKKKLK